MATHRKPRQRALGGTSARTAATLTMAGAASAGIVTGAAPGHAAPLPSPDEARAQLADLYRQAEEATQKYDGAKEQADSARRQLTALQDQLARRTQRMNLARDQLGALAAARYRTGGIDPTVQLMLSARPDQYLENATLLDHVGSARAAVLRDLAAQERRARQLRDEAAGKLAALTGAEQRLAAAKRTVEARLDRAKAVLDVLAPTVRATVLTEGDGPTRADRGTERAPLPTAPGNVQAPTARAAQAVAFAYAQLGKPYAWGATGPNAYDCSGLTQAAWAAAGVSLPRTTYTQIASGTRIAQSALRPGDLVFFYASVSHVGLYIGDGQMIHAPHPGAPVRISPVSEMPFAGAVRPG